MAKGNKFIYKSLAKDVVNGCIVQELPEIEYSGRMYSLFTAISPTHCIICGNTLNVDKHSERFIISSYGTIRCSVTYWVCSNPDCKKHYPDILIGVTGGANYSDEYIEKMNSVRYNGRCTLWNSCTIGEIFTEGLTDDSGRAPCPTTLWKYEQKQGKISAHELTNQDIDFNGALHIDGNWIKTGWRKYIEAQMGKKLTTKEWKKLRYKVIYVVATEDKVVLDFQITDIMASYLELVPLLNRIKTRISEENILKVVSDEERAIIGAVARVLPNAVHSFCV
ncbi:MAG TPA: transposase, partial [Methanosarcinaceae archaeon]|nr:transposase [Methanosarcinaceae archaeon]